MGWASCRIRSSSCPSKESVRITVPIDLRGERRVSLEHVRLHDPQGTYMKKLCFECKQQSLSAHPTQLPPAPPPPRTQTSPPRSP